MLAPDVIKYKYNGGFINGFKLFEANSFQFVIKKFSKHYLSLSANKDYLCGCFHPDLGTNLR